MKTVSIIIARIYIKESTHLLNQILAYLKNEAKIRGVSVFRAIGGFGDSGEQTSFLLDLSLDLPLTIEFFDTKENVEPALDHLSTILRPEHIIFWEAKAND